MRALPSFRRIRPRHIALGICTTLVIVYRSWIYCMGVIIHCFATWNLKSINFIGTHDDQLPRDLDGLPPPPSDLDLTYLAIARRVSAGERVEDVVGDVRKAALAVELEISVQEDAARAAAKAAGSPLPPFPTSQEPPISQMMDTGKLPFTTESAPSFVTQTEQALNWGPKLDETDLIVPPILHHIAIGMKTAPPKQWEQAANACVVIHPHWTRMYWDDAAAEKFIKAEHAWFWETWTNYRFNIQKADSLRYLVLYTYGGTYLDMDLMCRRSLDPLRKVQFLANAAHPVGVSNGFIMVPRHSPFISTLVTNLPTFNHYFLSPYASVMFSTGCMYISALHNIFPERETLKVLGGQQNRLSGKVETPLFRHLGASSWHQGDAKLFGKLGRWIKKVPIFGTEASTKGLPAPPPPPSPNHTAPQNDIPAHHDRPHHPTPSTDAPITLYPLLLLSLALLLFLAFLRFRHTRRSRSPSPPGASSPTLPVMARAYTPVPSSPPSDHTSSRDSSRVSSAGTSPLLHHHHHQNNGDTQLQKTTARLTLLQKQQKRHRHRRGDSDSSGYFSASSSFDGVAGSASADRMGGCACLSFGKGRECKGDCKEWKDGGNGDEEWGEMVSQKRVWVDL